MVWGTSNNFQTTLVGSITSDATSLTFTSTSGAPATLPFPITVCAVANGVATTVPEIMLVTALNTGTGVATVARAQEGTSAIAHTAGEAIIQGITAGTLANLPYWSASATGDTVISGTTTTTGSINGTTVPAGGSLTIGQSLRATGTSAAAWGAINLALAAAVTGVLPTANQAAQAIAGDGSGTTGALVVTGIQSQPVSATAATKGQLLIATAASAWGPVSATGDVAFSASTAGLTTVTGLQGNALPAPSGTNTVIQWSGTALSWATVSGGGITALTGDVTASGSGSVAATVARIQGQTVTSGALTKGNLFIATTTSNWASTAVTGDIGFSTVTPGLTTVNAISGSSPIAVTPNNLQWVAGASPNLSQVAAVSGAGTNFVITPQTATTTGANGSLEIDVSAPASGTAEAGILIKRGGTAIVSIQGVVSTGTSGAIYLGSTSSGQTATNYIVASAGTSGLLNGSSSLFLQVAAVNYLECVSSTVAFFKPAAGVSTGTPFAFASTTGIALSTGTVTLSSAQLSTPALSFTGTLTGAQTIAIGGKVSTFLMDFSGVTVGAFGITITNGAGSFVATTLLTSKTLLTVSCNTASTINVG